MKDFHNVKQNLLNFKNDYKQLKIINRKIPRNSDFFFNKVFKCLNSISGFVKYNSSKQDLGELLNRIITKDIKCDPFYRVWLDDMSNLCKLFCKFIGDNKISGVYNLTAPEVITNYKFTEELALVWKRPVFPKIFKAPSLIVKLLFGEQSSLVLNGLNVSSNKIESTSFKFSFTNIKSALKDIYR